MTNKELLDKIRDEILHLKMKELQRTNGINTGADVYLSSYAVLSILSNALTEESEDERIRKWLVDYFSSIKETVWIHRDITCGQILAWLEKQKINTEGDFGRGYDCGYQAGYAVAMNEMKPKVATATLDSKSRKSRSPHGARRTNST